MRYAESKNIFKMLIKIIDDKSCKMLRVETAKESENREKFPDTRTSTDIVTGTKQISSNAELHSNKRGPKGNGM